ncbi:MAG TPA: response regulator transcription factor [Candidatus Obscuribacter sp.]|nr:response regulator transcription factor [Candidatus Obscuribacter sp.]HMX44931.1 response regulator transcription factor [Candidatus Obscuribacter sp.]HMY51758.1 response regulator transcription factor [Candidatus Obscuribacter sp.]HND08559.1 response regulator transcription factor [Candidatus Obscuribacter sp.]HNG76759.1 response regulator transcription factor [Candidatus Obscuribacter sp.]
MKKVNVLIVEDNELMRQGLRSVLERTEEFCVVGEAEDGEEAVRLAQTLKPDVIVMDIGLPYKNGIEATRDIKQNLPSVNIVMLTSHDNDDEIFAALSAGAQGYCLKDCASERIKIALSSVSQGAAWIDPRIAQKVLSAFEGGRKDKSESEAEKSSPAASNAGSTASGGQDTLSAREKDVLRLMVDGASNKEISEKLIISISTVRTHVEHILEKLAVTGRTQAAVKAMKEGLV